MNGDQYGPTDFFLWNANGSKVSAAIGLLVCFCLPRLEPPSLESPAPKYLIVSLAQSVLVGRRFHESLCLRVVVMPLGLSFRRNQEMLGNCCSNIK